MSVKAYTGTNSAENAALVVNGQAETVVTAVEEIDSAANQEDGIETDETGSTEGEPDPGDSDPTSPLPDSGICEDDAPLTEDETAVDLPCAEETNGEADSGSDTTEADAPAGPATESANDSSGTEGSSDAADSDALTSGETEPDPSDSDPTSPLPDAELCEDGDSFTEDDTAEDLPCTEETDGEADTGSNTTEADAPAESEVEALEDSSSPEENTDSAESDAPISGEAEPENSDSDSASILNEPDTTPLLLPDPQFCQDGSTPASEDLDGDPPCAIERTTVQDAINDAAAADEAGIIYIQEGWVSEEDLLIEDISFDLTLIGGWDFSLNQFSGLSGLNGAVSILNSSGLIKFENIVFGEFAVISVENSSVEIAGTPDDDNINIELAGSEVSTVTADGGEGSDTLTIVGTNNPDSFSFSMNSTALGDETVNYSSTIENVNIKGNGNDDTYIFNNNWGVIKLQDDSGVASLDFSSYVGHLRVSLDGQDLIVDDGTPNNLVHASGSADFSTNISISQAQLTGLENGFTALADLGAELDEFEGFSELHEPIFLLSRNDENGDINSIGDFLDIGTTMQDYLIGPVTGSGLTLDSLIRALNNNEIAAVGTLTSDSVLSIDFDPFKVTSVTENVELWLGEDTSNLLLVEGLTADLITTFDWSFGVEVDENGNEFNGSSNSSMLISADVALDPFVFAGARAGFLGLDIGSFGANDSHITLDADLSVGVSDEFSFQSPSIDNLSFAEGSYAQVDIELYALSGIPGIANSETEWAEITFYDNLFDDTDPEFDDNFNDLSITDFYRINSDNMRTLLKQFETFLGIFNANGINLGIPLSHGQTINEVVDLAGVFKKEVLDLLELVPFNNETPISELNSGEGISTEDGSDIRITLNDGTAIDVDLDQNNPETLGDLVNLIIEAFPDDQIIAIQNPDGTLALADTSEQVGSNKFKIEAIGESKAASHLGLDRPSFEQDFNGENLLVIDVAPNPGPNYKTVQEMSDRLGATLGSISYDTELHTLSLPLNIEFACDPIDEPLALFDIDPLAGLITSSQVTLTPTGTLELPLEIKLTKVGFEISESTYVADLNGGMGVRTAAEQDDIVINLLDGTNFTVNLDHDMASVFVTELNEGTGIETISGNDIKITLRNGISFSVDLDYNPDMTVKDLLDVIKSKSEDAGLTDEDFIIITDANKGSYSLVDFTDGGGVFSIEALNGSQAIEGLSLDGSITQQVIDDQPAFILDVPVTTVEYLINKILNAAPSDLVANGQFDVQISGSGTGLLLKDVTGPTSAPITGTVTEEGFSNELWDSSASFGDNSLIGRYVIITAGTGEGQAQRIIGNQNTILTLETDWETPLSDDAEYMIPTIFDVMALNGSPTQVDLGLFGPGYQQRITTETTLDEANGGLGVGTVDGDDIEIVLHDDTTIEIDLAPADNSGLTLMDLVENIASSVQSVAGLEIFIDEYTQAVYFVSDNSFTINNIGEATAASDLMLNVESEQRDIDYDGDVEFSIWMSSPAFFLNGTVLHGDTLSAHIGLNQGSTNITTNVLIEAPDIDASGLWGIIGVEAIDGNASGNIQVEISFTDPGTDSDDAFISFRELNEGLKDPVILMDGGSPTLEGPLTIELPLEPLPAINGVAGGSGNQAVVQIEVTDIGDADEEPALSFSGDITDVQHFLETVQDLTFEHVFSYLNSAADYLIDLQTQSPIADQLPGLPQSLGSLLNFGNIFYESVADLIEISPQSIQAVEENLENMSQQPIKLAGNGIQDYLTPDIDVDLGFDGGIELFTIELDLDLTQHITQLPLTLDLSILGLEQQLTDLEMGAVSNIVDTTSASLLAVEANGIIHLDLGIDLSNPSNPSGVLLDSTEASFEISARNPSLNFDALFGSMMVTIVSGEYVLDLDGDLSTLDHAVYQVFLNADVPFDEALANTTVTLTGQMQAEFELALPQALIDRLTIDLPSSPPFIYLSIGDLNDPTGSVTLDTNLDGEDGNWPTFGELLNKYSLSDALNGFTLGFYGLFTKLDDLLDAAVFAQPLPLIGTQLTEAADFIEQIRDTVYDNLVQVSGILTPEIIALAFINALGIGGLGWLVDKNGDGYFNVEDDIDILYELEGTDRMTAVTFEMDLLMPQQQLPIPIDLDLLLPGLGFSIDAEADVSFGFSMPLNVGISIADGVFIDVSTTNELTIQLDVAIPTAVTSMHGDPQLIFMDDGAGEGTIYREEGSWISDGFKIGDLVSIEGSVNNNGDFIITEIDDFNRLIMLIPVGQGNNFVPEGPVTGISVDVKKVSMSGSPTLTFDDRIIEVVDPGCPFTWCPLIEKDLPDTITRDTGSWISDGFRVGQTIVIENSSVNNGDDYTISAIDPTGMILTLAGDSLSPGDWSNSVVWSESYIGLEAYLGVLPYRVWNTAPEGASELTGTYLIDLLDNNGNGNGRLSLSELITEFPGQQNDDTLIASAFPDLLTLTDDPQNPLTFADLHLKLETDLPPGTAFPPYRMDLDITSWDLTITNSIITHTTPTIEFNNVQFELVGFMRDFAGAAITRLRDANEPLDGLVDFLTSAAYPILSYFFGRTTYISAAENFGGEAEIGDFAGASFMLRNLADGGDPFDQGNQNWFREALEWLTILPANEFGGYEITAIDKLVGTAWIDIGSFSVDGAAARTPGKAPLTPIPTSVRNFGALGDDESPGTITDQILAIARDANHNAYEAALAFIATQMLPGRAGWEQFYAGGLVQFIVGLATESSIDPILYPIINDSNNAEGTAINSFKLLLGDTRFVDDDPEKSMLLEYGTPELRVTLYQDFPLDGKKWWNELPGAELIELIVNLLSGDPTGGLIEANPFLSVSFDTRADFQLYFDTVGLEMFEATHNPDDIVYGLYFDDTEGAEPNPALVGNESIGLGELSFVTDEPQWRVLGGVGFGFYAEINFVGLKAGIEAGFFIGGDFNFHDRNGDGKVRADEFDRNLSDSANNVYDRGIRMEGRLDVFVSLNPFGLFPLVDIRVNVITLGGTIGLPHNDIPAVLAVTDGSTLKLNVGDTNTRGYLGAETNEKLYVGYDISEDQIIVSGFGQLQTFERSSISKIEAHAGSGDDRIIINESVAIPVELHGGLGNDTLIVGGGYAILYGDGNDDYLQAGSAGGKFYGGSGNDIILGRNDPDSIWGGEGADILLGRGGNDEIFGEAGPDLIDGGIGDDYIEGGSENDFILGGVGYDEIKGGEGNDFIFAGDGGDLVEGGLGADIIDGGAGNDELKGEDGADVIFGGPHNDVIDGGDGADQLDGEGASDEVYGAVGNDVITSKHGNDFLNGQEDGDYYWVYFAGGRTITLVTILDSGDQIDTDLFIAVGTMNDDQFLLRANTDGSNAFVAILNYPTQEGDTTKVERINYSGLERIVVNGDFGDDHFAVDDTAAEVTLNGGIGNDTFQIGQLFRSERTPEAANVSVEDIFATIETTRGFLSNGISAPMTANGGLGEDSFIVFHNKAVLSLNGDDGDDLFEIRAFALVGSQEPQRERTDITGGAGADLVMYAVNAPVNINGGDGLDTLVVIGTEFGDDFVITEMGVFGAGLTINFVNIEALRVDGAEGDDRFYVKSTSEKFTTELFGGLGSDTFNMSGDAPPVVSNDLLGHSGLILHDVESQDERLNEQTLFGISANVADNDEPFVVIRQTGGSTIITEGGTLIDTYEIVLTRQPDLNVYIKALAPLPTPDNREFNALAFRLSSPEEFAKVTDDGTALTLTFTPDNWFIPQVVEVQADQTEMDDLAGIFTRPELGEDISFMFDDSAEEGVHFGVINHLVYSASDSLEGGITAITPSTTLTIPNPDGRLIDEFVGQIVVITNGSGAGQERMISYAESVGGDIRLYTDRAWLITSIPDSSSQFEVMLGDVSQTGIVINATNPTVTIEDSSILESNSMLGRKFEITAGSGAGQSRYIIGVQDLGDDSFELTLDRGWTLTDLPEAGEHIVILEETLFSGIYSPNILSFEFEVGQTAVNEVGHLTISTYADIDAQSEFLSLMAEGVDLGNIFEATIAGLSSIEHPLFNLFFGTPVLFGTQAEAILELSPDLLSTLIADGVVEFTLTPSSGVNRPYFATTRLTLQLEIPRLEASQYLVRIDDAIVGTVSSINEDIVPPSSLEYCADYDCSSFIDESGIFPITGEGLAGAILQIVGGPGAGQQRMILDNTETELILNGDWRTDPVSGESIYRIERYDGLAIPSVQVQINDNDAPYLITDETKGFENSEVSFGENEVDFGNDVITLEDHDLLAGMEVLYTTDGEITLGGLIDNETYFVILDSSSTIKLAETAEDADANIAIDLKSNGGASLHTLAYINILDDFDTITAVIENGDGDHLGEKDVLFVKLSRQPKEGAVVNVSLFYKGNQLEMIGADGSPISQLSFDENNWEAFQPVYVEAPADQVREGFHTSLIEFSITSEIDQDVPIDTDPEIYQIHDRDAVAFVGLRHEPIEGTVNVTYRGIELDEGTDGGTKEKPVFEVISNKVIFRVNGEYFKVSGDIEIDYAYVELGYDGAFVIPVLARISDYEVPTVLIRETDGSTDVIEVNQPEVSNGNPNEIPLIYDSNNVDTNQSPWIDWYELVLTAPPTSGDVTVTITPEITKTSRTGGILHHEVQVEIFSDDPRVQPGDNGILLVTFGSQNWDDPVVITVKAIDDGFVDGGDTKEFAPGPNTVSGLLGPVIVDGAAGQGSLTGIAPPVILPGETNIKEKTGDVISVEGTQIKVNTDDLEKAINELGLPGLDALIDKTIEVTATYPGIDPDPNNPTHSAVGQFRLITGVVQNGTETTLIINETYALNPGEYESDIQSYAITTESLNFFVDETTQVDYMFVHDEDSPADSQGFLTSTRLYGLNMGPDIPIGGRLLPGGITYGNLEVLEINLGTGNNDFSVLGTHIREDGFQTWTFLNTGNDIEYLGVWGDTVTIKLTDTGTSFGGEVASAAQATPIQFASLTIDSNPSLEDNQLAGWQITVEMGEGTEQTRRILYNEGNTIYIDGIWETVPYPGNENIWNYTIIKQPDGNFAVNTQDGDDNVDASASNLGITIFGGPGDDLLIGGSGSDIIFGDDGRVDYYNEEGLIITRLGYFRDDTLGNGQENIGTVDSATTYSLTDNKITFPTIDEGLSGLILNIINGTGAPQTRRILSNTEHTLVIDSPWEEIPDETSEYRISFVPENQTDGVTRDPQYLMTVHMDNGGNDILFGQPGEDLLIGGSGDDSIDGNSEKDLIFGDNVKLDRRVINDGEIGTSQDFTNPRFRVLSGTEIYDPTGEDQVDDGMDFLDPAGAPVWANWDIYIHEEFRFNFFGNDYLAGGSEDDMIFGQLGNDVIQGDGSIISLVSEDLPVGAARDILGILNVQPSFDDFSDGDDYIEGNGGNDVIFGNLGQDDLIGGSSSLFSLVSPELRPDDTDLIFGGSGTWIERNAYVGSQYGTVDDDLMIVLADRHARDADVIVGDNGNIFRLVGIEGVGTGQYLAFSYDTYSANLQIIPRVVELLDYTSGGPDYNAAAASNDIGAGDELHGETGDDGLYGMTGDDVLFGESEDDDLIGGWGHDWISGGSGDDGVLGDDGRTSTSRNGIAEPLYGIGDLAGELDTLISTPGKVQQSVINVEGQLKKTVNLEPFNLDPAVPQDPLFDPLFANDIIYGGLGNDFLHGGAGDDAVSGAEALPNFYANPNNPGDILEYGKYQEGEFAAYDENDPWSVIPGFLLNFDPLEGPSAGVYQSFEAFTDGDDVIFGDLGNDWMVGGTGEDHLYGGYGDDLLNVDDDHGTNGGANNAPDTHPSYEDVAYGGAGRDVLIANTGGDRLIDWAGEFNSYVVPFAPFGVATVSRTLQPQLMDYLYALSASDGADPTRADDVQNNWDRNGEPHGELGLVKQRDPDWNDQTGGPADPQPGNTGGGKRDVLRTADSTEADLQVSLQAEDTSIISETQVSPTASTSKNDKKTDVFIEDPPGSSQPENNSLIEVPDAVVPDIWVSNKKEKK